MNIAKGITGYFFISKNNDGFNLYPSEDLLLFFFLNYFYIKNC